MYRVESKKVLSSCCCCSNGLEDLSSHLFLLTSPPARLPLEIYDTLHPCLFPDSCVLNTGLHSCYSIRPSYSVHVSYLSLELRTCSFLSVNMHYINHTFIIFSEVRTSSRVTVHPTFIVGTLSFSSSLQLQITSARA